MHRAGNMTPFETQRAVRAVRISATPRTPAGWRAYVHLQRVWLIADVLPGRQRPSTRRTKGRSTVFSSRAP
jgi:hypothetical protein